MNVELLPVLVGLLAFGLVYDRGVITPMNADGARRHPLTSFQVALGVLVTIGGAWLVDGDRIAVTTLLICFATSGAPMIAGDARRWYAT